jgi:hypothetical protein
MVTNDELNRKWNMSLLGHTVFYEWDKCVGSLKLNEMWEGRIDGAQHLPGHRTDLQAV